ncbi:PDC sensor domain-containing protein [Methylorubrum extorquens]
MRHGLFSSLRSMLALLLALAAGLGGLAILGTADIGISGGRQDEGKGREGAALIAERVEDALLSVGRDLALISESLALQAPEGVEETAERLFAAWLRLHPEYADVLLADRVGRVLATSRQRIVGADVSGSPWFAKSLAGIVIGEAADASRAGAAVPRNLIVAVPVDPGEGVRGVLAVQLTPQWTDAVIAAARRSLPDAGRGLSIQMLNGSGRTLHRSGPEIHGPDVSATVGDVRRGGVGWLVSMRVPEAPPSGLPVLTLLGTVGLVAGFGWLMGGQLKRNLAHAEALCRQETDRRRPSWFLTRDLHDLTAQIRSAVDRSLSRERLLQEKRAALARSRDRIRAIRALSGSSCWEINRATGQVVWTDGDEAENGAAPERVCALGDVLAHLVPEDRAALGNALDAVQAAPGTVRDVVVRTRAGTERISGRRLALRIAADRAGSTRLYAVSREYTDPALAAPVSPRASAEPVPPQVEKAACDLDSALTATMTALGALLGEATDAGDWSRRLAAAALGGAERGASIARRVRAPSREDRCWADTTMGAAVAASDLTVELDGIVALLRAAATPEMTLAVSRDSDLPLIRCSREQVESALLALVGDLDGRMTEDASATLRVEASALDARRGVRISLSAACDVSSGRGLSTVRSLLHRLGGQVALGGRPHGSTVSLWFPASGTARPAGLRPASTASILLVEADPLLRTALSQSLESLGHRVTATGTAVQASLQLKAERGFDLLLCEHSPPGSDVAHLVSSVARTHPRLRTVLTSVASNLSSKPASANVLCRPFGLAELAATVASAISEEAVAA